MLRSSKRKLPRDAPVSATRNHWAYSESKGFFAMLDVRVAVCSSVNMVFLLMHTARRCSSSAPLGPYDFTSLLCDSLLGLDLRYVWPANCQDGKESLVQKRRLREPHSGHLAVLGGSRIGNMEVLVVFVCLIQRPEETLVSAISHSQELLEMTKLFGTEMVRGLRSAVHARINSRWTE